MDTSNGYGQSFTPTLSGIDAFEFFASESGPVTATNWQINLREGTLTGTILGTSTPVSGVFSAGNPINFMFSSTIALTPGNVYVSEILFSTASTTERLAANLNIFFDPNPPGDVYADGELLGLGSRPLDDYKFREGLSAANPIPEPSTMLLFGSGLVGLLAWRIKKVT